MDLSQKLSKYKTKHNHSLQSIKSTLKLYLPRRPSPPVAPPTILSTLPKDLLFEISDHLPLSSILSLALCNTSSYTSFYPLLLRIGKRVALHYALETNNPDLAARICPLFPEILNETFPLSNGLTPLQAAVDSENVQLMKILLDNGADPDQKSAADGFTALHIAAHKQHWGPLKLLLESGADPRVGAKMHFHQNHEISWKQNGWTVIHLMACVGPTHRFRHLLPYVKADDLDLPLESHGKHTPIVEAIVCSRPGICRILVEKGININRSFPTGSTVLLIACGYAIRQSVKRGRRGRRRRAYYIVKLLVDNGADVEKARELLSEASVDSQRFTGWYTANEKTEMDWLLRDVKEGKSYYEYKMRRKARGLVVD